MNRYFLNQMGIKNHLKLCIVDVDGFKCLFNVIFVVDFTFENIIY